MVIERNSELQVPAELSNGREKPQLPPHVLENILKWSRDKFFEGVQGTFEQVYVVASEYREKYSITRALIEDGRYKDPKFLVKEFVSNGSIPTPEVQKLKDELQLLLVERGIITPNSKKEDEEAQDAVLRMFDARSELKKLRFQLPPDAINALGAISTMLLFENVSEEEKKERLRSIIGRALVRPYLGDLVIQKPIGDIDFRNLIELVPERVFTDVNSMSINIIKDYFVNKAMGLFINGEEAGFSELEQIVKQEVPGLKKDFLKHVRDEFEKVAKTEIPDNFVITVKGAQGEDLPFPHFRQKYFVHEFLKTRRKLLHGETGATKTACGYLAMEASGAHRVTIIAPAQARKTWPEQAGELFQQTQQPDVFAIRGSKDLDSQRLATAKYVFISSELISKAWNDNLLYQKIISALVEYRLTDGLIVDEIDVFRNEDANCSKMLVALVSKIQTNYYSKFPLRPPLPMVGLTATPMSSDIVDFDIPLAVLYPERFSLPGIRENGKYPFSIQCLRDPKIAYSLLFGEKLLIQWTLKDLFGDKAPELRYESIGEKEEGKEEELVLSPYHEALYQWVAGLQVDLFTKTRLLQSVLLNPELVKKTCSKRGLVPQATYTYSGLKQHFLEFYKAWEDWMLTKDPRIPDEPFSSDWIAKFGDTQFLIDCFFNPNLVYGIESLAGQFPDIYIDWYRNNDSSSKYAFLKRALQNHFNNGGSVSEKVFIVSPYHKKGITRWLDDPNVVFDDDTLSLYDELRGDWLPTLPSNMIANIDGDKTATTRSRQSAIWREDGTRNAIVVASMQSVLRSMDWAVRDLPQNHNIEHVSVYFLGWPWGWTEFRQMAGRFIRPKQGKPTDIYIFEVPNTIDVGLRDTVYLKYLKSLVALSGTQLSKEDQEFLRKATKVRKMVLEGPKVGQLFLQDTARRLQGAGEGKAKEELSKERDGVSHFTRWAQEYFDNGRDEFRIVGNNAELVKNIILQPQPQKILSVGAGTCLFARKIGYSGYDCQIDNIDFNAAVLRVTQEQFPTLSRTNNFIVGDASKIQVQDQIYDAIDCSFMLPWSQLFDSNQLSSRDPREIERVKILLEMHRVLRNEGMLVISTPEASLDTESFVRFSHVLSDNFGFKLLNSSGTSFATDIKPKKRIGWVLTLQKADKLSLSGLRTTDLAFLTDARYRVSQYKEERSTNNGTVQVQYPIFSSRNFEVRNPVTNEVVSANPVMFETVAQILARIKENTTPANRGIWIAARRRLERQLGRTYEEAEALLAGILTRRGLTDQKTWESRNIDRIITSEIAKILHSRNIS